MKKLIIATSILFAFSATFAQEGKPSKKTPMSSKAPTSVSANEAKPNMKPNVKPNVKPVGKTSTKPAPVVSKVSPVKGAQPVGPSSNRAAASSNVNTSKAEKVSNNRAAASSKVNTSKAEKVSNNRAAASSKVNTSKAEKVSNNRAAASSKVNTSKAEKVSNNRAAASSSVNTSKAEKVSNNRAAASSSVNTSKAEKTTISKTSTKGEKGEVSETAIKSKKPDADYCKGWKEGYIKAYAKATGEKISSADVPNCVSQGDCEGYKCGYAAGVKNAEKRIK
jgi:hypothetical protein